MHQDIKIQLLVIPLLDPCYHIILSRLCVKWIVPQRALEQKEPWLCSTNSLHPGHHHERYTWGVSAGHDPGLTDIYTCATNYHSLPISIVEQSDRQRTEVDWCPQASQAEVLQHGRVPSGLQLPIDYPAPQERG